MDIRKVRVGLIVMLAVGVSPWAGAGPKPDEVKDKLKFQDKKPGLAQPPALAKEIKNTLGMKLILIREGAFLMGSAETEEGRELLDKGNEFQHKVKITKPFYLGKYEVTKAEFGAFVKATGYKTEAEKDGAQFTWRYPNLKQTDRHPVVYVSWNDAVAFCTWLSEKETKDGRTYRLPTEAEWEYACRAGTTTRFHSGDDEASLKQVAQYWRNGPLATRPVGELQGNAWGLHDLHGNVWEWCQDWYAKDYYKHSPREDPQGPATGETRVFRGGFWGSGPLGCRAALRLHNTPSFRFHTLGFRVVLVR